jgi:hypothetical protein
LQQGGFVVIVSVVDVVVSVVVVVVLVVWTVTEVLVVEVAVAVVVVRTELNEVVQAPSTHPMVVTLLPVPPKYVRAAKIDAVQSPHTTRTTAKVVRVIIKFAIAQRE